MKTFMTSIALVFVSALFVACANEETGTTNEQAAIIANTATTNDMVGAWKFEDVDVNIKLNVDLPGIEQTMNDQILKSVKKSIKDVVISYNNDGTFQINGGKEKAGGKYTFENDELLHTSFSNEKNVVAHAKAQVENDILTLQIGEEQFWKMMASVDIGEDNLQQIKNMLTIKHITYKFKKN